MEKQRILTVVLQSEFSHAPPYRRVMNYNGSSVELTDGQYENLISVLPEFWHNDRDRLINFVVFEDKSYVCEKAKKVFNYTHRDKEIKIYRFDAATVEQSTEIFNIFLKFFSDLKISQVENLYENILESMNNISYLKFSLLSAREKLLKDSDYMFLQDYTFSDEEEKQKWIEYRQELRDITETEAWKNNEFEKIVLPVSPTPISQYQILMAEITKMIYNTQIPDTILESFAEEFNKNKINLEKTIQDFVNIQIKVQLLNAISKMNIPIFDINPVESFESISADLNSMRVEYDSNLDASWKTWEYFNKNIAEKIQKINERLSENGINFSLYDVYSKITEENKKIVTQRDEAIDIINEISKGDYV